MRAYEPTLDRPDVCAICGSAWTARDGLVVCSACDHVRWVQPLSVKIAAGTGGAMRKGYRNDDDTSES